MIREIIDRVWIGSEPNIKMIEQCRADALVCTIAKGSDPAVVDRVSRYSCYPIPDGKRFDNELFVLAMEDIINWYREGRTVLVHCRAGRNRSATAIAMFLIEHFDWEPQAAIEHIRTIRPRAIANPVFEDHLLRKDF